MHRSPGLDIVRPHADSGRPGQRAARAERWDALGSEGRTIWLTGLPGAGKTTLAAGLERRLLAAGRLAVVLDGDELRGGLTSDLGFSREARAENVRRIGEVARTMADAGMLVIVAVVSPYAADRDAVREVHAAAGLRFSEVWVSAPSAVCAARDPKGLYAKAARGEMRGLTGQDAPYEVPELPELVIKTDQEPVERALDRLEAFLQLD
jgi:bifunctional enzyme CysN/CysC